MRCSPAVMAIALLAALLGIASACGGGSQVTTPAQRAFVPVTQETIPPTIATPAASPTPDFAAIARAHGCTITPFSTMPPSNWNDFLSYPHWYSANGLWLAPYSPSVLGFAKMPGAWWAGSTPVWILTPPGVNSTPAVSGQRLDGAGTLGVQPGTIRTPFILDFSTAGCWKVSVADAGHALSFTAYVLPHSERPDIAGLLATHTFLQPYSIPPSCAATHWKGPEDRFGVLHAGYWLDGNGITAGSSLGLLWAGAENTVEFWLKAMGPISVSGNAAGDPSTTLRVSLNDTQSQGGEHWVATIVFPTAGCWQVAARAGSQTFAASVYVYPEACKRNPGTPVASACHAPSP